MSEQLNNSKRNEKILSQALSSDRLKTESYLYNPQTIADVNIIKKVPHLHKHDRSIITSQHSNVVQFTKPIIKQHIRKKSSPDETSTTNNLLSSTNSLPNLCDNNSDIDASRLTRWSTYCHLNESDSISSNDELINNNLETHVPICSNIDNDFGSACESTLSLCNQTVSKPLTPFHNFKHKQKLSLESDDRPLPFQLILEDEENEAIESEQSFFDNHQHIVQSNNNQRAGSIRLSALPKNLSDIVEEDEEVEPSEGDGVDSDAGSRLSYLFRRVSVNNNERRCRFFQEKSLNNTNSHPNSLLSKLIAPVSQILPTKLKSILKIDDTSLASSSKNRSFQSNPIKRKLSHSSVRKCGTPANKIVTFAAMDDEIHDVSKPETCSHSNRSIAMKKEIPDVQRILNDVTEQPRVKYQKLDLTTTQCQYQMEEEKENLFS